MVAIVGMEIMTTMFPRIMYSMMFIVCAFVFIFAFFVLLNVWVDAWMRIVHDDWIVDDGECGNDRDGEADDAQTQGS